MTPCRAAAMRAWRTRRYRVKAVGRYSRLVDEERVAHVAAGRLLRGRLETELLVGAHCEEDRVARGDRREILVLNCRVDHRREAAVRVAWVIDGAHRLVHRNGCAPPRVRVAVGERHVMRVHIIERAHEQLQRLAVERAVLRRHRARRTALPEHSRRKHPSVAARAWHVEMEGARARRWAHTTTPHGVAPTSKVMP